MPIRKRLSDPFGDSVKRFERQLKEGRPPPAPKKPSAVERAPFVDALMAVPMGKCFDKSVFFRKHFDKAITASFKIWGQTLYIMPAYMYLDEGTVKCTGASVGRHNPNRRGIKPMLRLKGEPRTWYSQVIHWIDDTVYDGEA